MKGVSFSVDLHCGLVSVTEKGKEEEALEIISGVEKCLADINANGYLTIAQASRLKINIMHSGINIE